MKGATFASAMAAFLENHGFVRADPKNLPSSAPIYYFDVGYSAGRTFSTIVMQALCIDLQSYSPDPIKRSITINFRSDDLISDATCDIYLTVSGKECRCTTTRIRVSEAADKRQRAHFNPHNLPEIVLGLFQSLAA